MHLHAAHLLLCMSTLRVAGYKLLDPTSAAVSWSKIEPDHQLTYARVHDQTGLDARLAWERGLQAANNNQEAQHRS